VNGGVPPSGRGLRPWGGALVVLLACAPIATAAPPAKAKPGPKAAAERPDVFAGYSFVHSGSANLHGWQVSGSYPIWRSLSLVGDVSGHYGSFAGADLADLELLAGGRWYGRWRRLRPFAGLLLGAVRNEASVATPDGTISSTGTDLALTPGFGADHRMSSRWAVRFGLDLLLVRVPALEPHLEGGWESNPRLSLGAVYSFGGR
jgi:hypothetical protein